MMTNVKWMCLAAVAGSLCLNARAAAPASLRGGASAPTNVAPDVWAKIAPQLSAAQYAFEADTNGVFKARNPAHGFELVADESGVRVVDAAPSPREMLVLRAVKLVEATPSSLAGKESGEGAASTLLPRAVRPVAQGARLEYRRGTVTEWFENREEGLEQGFTIESPSDSSALSELQLLVDIAGARAVTVEADGRRARITDEQGRDFGYGGLKAWDATGRSLACRLEEVRNRHGSRFNGSQLQGCRISDEKPNRSAEGGSASGGEPLNREPLNRAQKSVSLLIVCDAQSAVYPVAIDPVLTSMEKKLTAADGAASDQFGYSASVTGDVALVGAPFDDAPVGKSGG